jgi:hypothetical protein
MKKLLTIFTLSLFAQLTFGQNCEKEQLIKDIENYISEIDSLIKYGKGFQEYHYSTYLGGDDTLYWGRGGGSEYFLNSPPFPEKDSLSMDEWNKLLDEYEKIVTQTKIHSWDAFVKEHKITEEREVTNSRNYYQNGKLVAVFFSIAWYKSENNDRATKLYINDGKIIYHEGEKEQIESIMKRHNLTFE